MGRGMTELEWAQKADYEGGFMDAYFGYGLDESDLEDQDSELAQLLRAHSGTLHQARDAIEDIEDRLAEVLDEWENE